jgi:multiple sugar transport system substrate-binding protein
MTTMAWVAVRRWALMIGVLGLCGCTSKNASQTAPAMPFKGVKLVVGTIDDPAVLETVNAQRAEWEERNGAQVAIKSDSKLNPDGLAGVDVVVFPDDRLGDLEDVQALFAIQDSSLRPPAPSDADTATKTETSAADTFAFSDFLPPFRDKVSLYGNKRLGLPLGGSGLVLVYRRDAFENEEARRAVKEAGLPAEPPRTWDQLDSLAKLLNGRDWDGDGAPESGIAIAWGADPEGVGDAIFLTRAAALGLHPDQFSFLFDGDTMEPRIASPPFVEALAGLAALKSFGPKDCEAFDAEAARAAFRAGSVALLIDRAERASRWTDAKTPLKVGVAALPGSTRLYEPERASWGTITSPNRSSYLPFGGGWLLGIAKSASERQRDAALDFTKYLTGPEASGRILTDRAFPMLPTRSAQLATGMPDPRSAPGVDARLWGLAVAETLTAARVEPGLRIPDSSGYLADLEKARVAAVGGQSAEKALQSAAAAWTERTKKLGKERQLWHYRRSLNRHGTTPEPPPR